MSLGIWVACPTCDRCFADWSPTYNLGPMWEEAGIKDVLYECDGKLARDMVTPLDAALELMRSDPPRFKKHNPPNGWGDYEGALRVLDGLLRACRKHPECVMKTWR